MRIDYSPNERISNWRTHKKLYISSQHEDTVFQHLQLESEEIRSFHMSTSTTTAFQESLVYLFAFNNFFEFSLNTLYSYIGHFVTLLIFSSIFSDRLTLPIFRAGAISAPTFRRRRPMLPARG